MHNISGVASLAMMQVDKTTSAYRSGYICGQVFVYGIVAIIVIWAIRKGLSFRKR